MIIYNKKHSREYNHNYFKIWISIMKNRIFRPWKIEYSDRDNIDWYFDHENIDENFDHENIDEIIDHENIRSWNISIMKFLILDVYDRDNIPNISLRYVRDLNWDPHILCDISLWFNLDLNWEISMLFVFKYEFISTESASNWRHFKSSTKLVVSMSWGWKTDEKQHRGQSQIWRNYLDKKLVANFASLFSKLCFFIYLKDWWLLWCYVSFLSTQ